MSTNIPEIIPRQKYSQPVVNLRDCFRADVSLGSAESFPFVLNGQASWDGCPGVSWIGAPYAVLDTGFGERGFGTGFSLLGCTSCVETSL